MWHNYGFDRHVMNNENINCKGFYGDTMHMARLWDTSRDKATGGGGGEGYSLESLSSELIKNPKFTKVGWFFIYLFFLIYLNQRVLYIISIKKNMYKYILYLLIHSFTINTRLP